MSFSREWDERYRANTHLSVWPWSDLVSYVLRYSSLQKTKECNVLELGSGAGANIPLFKQLAVNYFGIEGSSSIVALLKEKFPEYSENIRCADFTSEIPFTELFDIVIDRASLTHNDTASIKKCLSLVLDRMKPGASFIGIDWFSTKHSDYNLGVEAGDTFTRSVFNQGQFVGVGKVHFSDENHIVDLFRGFEVKILEEKIIKKTIPLDNHIFSSWNIHAVKM